MTNQDNTAIDKVIATYLEGLHNPHGESLYNEFMSKRENPWDNAKHFRIFGYYIPVLKGSQDGDRKFYAELHKDDAYLASMGSSMPTYWLAALETYIKRGSLL